MKKLEKLTIEQEKLMYEVRDEWVNLALKENAKGINKPLFEEGIEWLYGDLLNKPKPKIVYCDSWISCLITITIFKKLSHKQIEKLGDSVGDSVAASVAASVGDSVRASVWDSVWDSVAASVVDSVRASVVASVETSVWASVGDSVWADLNKEFSNFSNYNGISNFGWVSFYDFFERIKVIDNFKFKQYKKLIKSNCFNAYEYENYVFAIQPPIVIKRNNSGQLHSPNDAAIQFKDGTQYFYINGRSLPSWIWEKAEKGEITQKMFIDEKNAEIKGGIYEVLGQKRMIDLLGAKEVDTRNIVHKNGDIETVTLLKTEEIFEEIGNQPFAWVKMVCPSTGTQYLQGVEPHHTDALKAIASLSMFKPEEYSFDMRS